MIYITLAIFFYFFNNFFITIWKKKISKTPTGVGVIFILHLIYYFINNDYSFYFLLPLLIFSIIYFLDDIISINFILRLIIQILTPILIYFAIIKELNVFILLASIIFFFVLMNSINFQDGEDLNIVILLTMIFLAFNFYSEDILTKNTSIFILIYLLSFAIFNSKKNSLYFGDSGCFLISIICLLFLISNLNNEMVIKSFLSIMLFPVVDVFYVAFYRIYKRENLLSRNYYHVYQILKNKTKWKLYLIPNIIFGITNLLISTQIYLNINYISILLSLNLFFCITIHFIINKLKNYNED